MWNRGAVGLLGLGIAASLALPVSATASALSWSAPQLVDHARPFGHSTPVPEVACPSVSLCVAVDSDGNVLTSTSPADGRSAWTVTRVDPGNSLEGVACPAVSLCVAFDRGGNIVSSTDPTGGAGAWSVANVAPSRAPLPLYVPLNGLACPSVSLCVAIGGGGNLYVSTNPAGGAGAWTQVAADPGKILAGITCPSVSLCVASDNSGDVVSSTDPGGGAGAWSVASLFPDPAGGLVFGYLSCPSTSLCVASDGGGDLATSSDPAGGAAAWQHAHIHFTSSLTCPSTTLCVARTQTSGFVVSTDPTGGAAAWRVERPYPQWVENVACPLASLCLAFDSSGNVFGSVDPAGGDSTWTKPVRLDPPICLPSTCTYGMQSVACPSGSLCVIADHFGHVFNSKNPTDGSSWRPAVTEAANSMRSLSCPSPSLCVAVDDAGRRLSSINPTAGPNWKQSGSGGQDTGVTCASKSLCIAWETNPFVPYSILSSSSDPAGGARTWKSAVLTSGPIGIDGYRPFISDMACPSRALCVAVTQSGVLTTTHPASRNRPWKHADVDPNDVMNWVSCPSVRLCVIATSKGNIVSSSNPSGRARAWRVVHIDNAPPGSYYFNGLETISCPTTQLCIALDAVGNVFTSSQPTGGPRAWTRAYLQDLVSPLVSPTGPPLACASASLCMISDMKGNLLTSTDPARGASSWTITPVDLHSSVTSLSCPSRVLCVAGDKAGNELVGRSPSK